MSTDIIKTVLSLIGSYNNTPRADPMGLTMDTDVWRNDVKGGSDGHLILCIRHCVWRVERKWDTWLLNKEDKRNVGSKSDSWRFCESSSQFLMSAQSISLSEVDISSKKWSKNAKSLYYKVFLDLSWVILPSQDSTHWHVTCFPHIVQPY